MEKANREKNKPLSYIAPELTNYCNYQCNFCPHSKKSFQRPRGFMAFELFKRIIDEANEISREVNLGFFGEQMLHPEFLKFMSYLKNRNPELRVVMNTNLSYATREIFEKLIEIDFTELRLSIDAVTPRMYELIRPGKHWLDLDGNPGLYNRFNAICEKAEYWLSLNKHRPTRIVYTVNSRNIEELKGFVNRWLSLLGEKDFILTKNVISYGGKISDNLIFQTPCNVWDLNMFTIDWTGRVSPCNLDTNMELAIGYFKEGNLLELLKGEKRKKMEQLSKEKKITCCRNCVDGNNWTKNYYFRKGDKWSEEFLDMYKRPLSS